LFRFRLERVLEYRAGLEKAAEQKLAVALEEKNRCSLALAEYRRRFEEAIRSGYCELRDLAANIHLDFYRETLLKQIKHGEELLEAAGRQVELCYHNLVSARQERMALEKLKEKQMRGYKVRLTQAEQKINDEIAAALFKHKKDVF